MRHVTTSEVVAAMRRLPRGGENPGCVYTDRDGRHCAVGEVFVDLGVPCPSYDPIEADGYALTLNGTSLGSEGRDVWRWLAEQGVTFDAEAERLLNDLQFRLDSSEFQAWGDAVAATLAVAR